MSHAGKVWQCSGCRVVIFNPWAPFCPSCGKEGYLTGSVNPDDLNAALEAAGEPVRDEKKGAEE